MKPDERHAARQLLGHYGYPGGYTPGGFVAKLIDAMGHADQSNLEKLLRAFPEFRNPVTVMREHGGEKLAKLLADAENAES